MPWSKGHKVQGSKEQCSYSRLQKEPKERSQKTSKGHRVQGNTYEGTTVANVTLFFYLPVRRTGAFGDKDRRANQIRHKVRRAREEGSEKVFVTGEEGPRACDVTLLKKLT